MVLKTLRINSYRINVTSNLSGSQQSAKLLTMLETLVSCKEISQGLTEDARVIIPQLLLKIQVQTKNTCTAFNSTFICQVDKYFYELK